MTTRTLSYLPENMQDKYLSLIKKIERMRKDMVYLREETSNNKLGDIYMQNKNKDIDLIL